MHNLDSILLATIKIAKKAGKFLKQESINFNQSKIEYKGLNDIVSYVDRASEQLCIDELRKILPEAGFITEESAATGHTMEYKWVIDPLDGTTNFIHGLPVYAVSIGLIYKEKPVLGVIYDPNRDECFSAGKGIASKLNNEKIQVSGQKKLSESLIITGLPVLSFEYMDFYMNSLRYLMKNTHGVRRSGSAALDLAYVACGRFDAQFEVNLKPYDVCAGISIIQSAGGLVEDFYGGKDYLFGNTIISGSPQILSQLRELIHKNRVNN